MKIDVILCIYRVSYLEIYNEVIYDLLSTLPQSSPSAAAPSPPASTGLQVTDVRTIAVFM